MHRSVIDAIGNTPLIRLRRASEETGCEILGKAEFMNPRTAPACSSFATPSSADCFALAA